MNQIDAKVIEVLESPKFLYERWFVKVKITAYGHESETDLMFNSEEEALEVHVGKIVVV